MFHCSVQQMCAPGSIVFQSSLETFTVEPPSRKACTPRGVALPVTTVLASFWDECLRRLRCCRWMLHSALADLTLLAGLGLSLVSLVGPDEQASLSTGFPPNRAAVDTWCRKTKTFRVTLHDPDYTSVSALGCCRIPPCVPAVFSS